MRYTLSTSGVDQVLAEHHAVRDPRHVLELGTAFEDGVHLGHRLAQIHGRGC
jgi:hypothetical protein